MSISRPAEIGAFVAVGMLSLFLSFLGLMGYGFCGPSLECLPGTITIAALPVFLVMFASTPAGRVLMWILFLAKIVVDGSVLDSYVSWMLLLTALLTLAARFRRRSTGEPDATSSITK
jgi:hypothetical protein